MHDGILGPSLRDPSPDSSGPGSSRPAQSETTQSAPSDVLVISATFTAEPVAEAIDFWLGKLGLPFRVEFAPYSQVFQQLMDPSSLLARNRRGINTLLIRIEDWQRQEHAAEEAGDGPALTLQAALVDEHVRDLVGAIRGYAGRASVPTVLVICPCSPHLTDTGRALVRQAEESLHEQLRDLDGLYLVGAADIERLYPVPDYYDAKADALGHVPFTAAFFAALATVLARKVFALTQPPYKVIALDCDQTLWKGVCGEDGPLGIELDPPRRMLQQFMVEQSQAGMLICLCSKNVEEDVWAVFDQRSDMPLKREHIVASRINWLAKSENLRALASELNLGLDSFIFVDDNPVECSEVGARCPEVLTLELPRDVERIPSFLRNVWPLDRVKVTDADRQRTAMYRQNLERERFQRAGQDFESFIEGLQLQIDVAPMAAGDLARVAQLTQRTNQFNATTIRRTEAEIQQWCSQQGHGCLTVHVKDRFGDYGLVGVILHRMQHDALFVDSFLLSCRVLGRGVEHRMVAELGKLASGAGASSVILAYCETAKNRPVADFLEAIGKDYGRAAGGQVAYDLPLAYARDLRFQPGDPASQGDPREESSQSASGDSAERPAPRARPDNSARWNEIAQTLTSPADVVDAVNRHLQAQRQPSRVTVDPAAPRNAVETTLARIWSEVLHIDRIGIHDNFFDLGGTSVLAVGIFTRIEDHFDRRLPLTTLLSSPTVAQLAQVVSQDADATSWSPLVPVRTQGSRPPLFVVHGGFGDVLGLADLAAYVSEEQPFFAIRAFGLDSDQTPLDTIEAIAEQYIQAIRTVQPEGPYRIAGHCAGGIVAYEMAQQLTRDGQRVEFCGLVETAHPQVENQLARRLGFYYNWGEVVYRDPRSGWTHYLLLAAAYWRAFRIFGGRQRREFLRRSWAGRLKYLTTEPLGRLFGRRSETADGPAADKAGLGGGPASDRAGASEAEIRFARAKQRFFETFVRAQKAYRPRPYSGRIDFFLTLKETWVPQHHPYDPRSLRTRGLPVRSQERVKFGWDRLVTADNFVIHPVDIIHVDMLGDPEIRQLGAALEHRLAQIGCD